MDEPAPPPPQPGEEPRGQQPQSSYDFTAAEAPAFREAVMQVQSKVNELNAMIRLLVAQNRLPDGNWQVKADLAGLIRVG